MTRERPRPLAGKVAVVAGATRGAGRGIACGLGEAGATVYCTGRSVRGRPASGEERPETIEETAERVTALGGAGIHVRVDHTVESEVEALFARVRREQGRLDVLVNDIWGGEPLTEWGKPFWQLDLDKGRRMLEAAVGSHVVTSRHGVPLLLEGGGGLVVEITDGVGSYYRGNLFYDLAKVSVIRLAWAMSRELLDRPVTALAVTPGFLRSEAMLDHFGVGEENWRDAASKDRHFAASETPTFIGRAVAALAADPEVGRHAGRTLATWNLAREYGFTDADGSRPDWGAYFRGVLAGILRGLADRGAIPDARAAGDGEIRGRFEQALREEFDRVGLLFWLTGQGDGFPGRVLELGPQPEAAAIEALTLREYP